MPTIYEGDGFQIRFYSRDRGEPPHVHVVRNRDMAKIFLAPVRLDRSQGYTRRELAILVRLVEANEAEFLGRWHGHFG